MALLRAVGHEGRAFLQSVGFNMRESSYEKAFALLDDHYGRKKNIFVKTDKFVSVSQLAGEDDRDYLVRVERLSRDAGFDNADALRRRYCFVLAINGLRDINLRMQLMAKSSLNWEELKRLLKARSVAMHAIDVLVGNHFDGATSIKREVRVVYNNTKSSTYRACDHYEASRGYNSDSGHSKNYLGEAECNACSKHYHDSHDRSNSWRPPSRQSHSRRSDGYDGKHESGGMERSNDFRPASPYFHGRHEFSNNDRKSTKDHSSSSKYLSRNARDYHRESHLRRDSSYKCCSREKPYSSRERFSKPSDVCYVCGRQGHYKTVCPEIECHKQCRILWGG